MKLNIPIGQEFKIDPKAFRQRGLGMVGWTKSDKKKFGPSFCKIYSVHNVDT
jgi:hypothetical protein